MTYEVFSTDKGDLARVVFDADEAITDFSSFFDALMGAPAVTVIIAKEKITDRFFDLKSGLAGEILQKVSNYRKRLVIVGDFSGVTSKPLQDFIRESNRGGQVLFVESEARAVELLR